MIGRPEQLGVAVNREKMGQTIRKVIEERGARSLGERTEIYSAARASVRKATNDEPAVMAELDQTIDEIETSCKEKPEITKNRRGGAGLALLVVGAVLGGAAAAAGLVFVLRLQPVDPIAAKLKQQYDATAPLVPIAVDYLHKVRDAVVEMQKNDPDALEAKAGKRFIPVASLDSALWKQFPKSMPLGTGVLLRANKKNYKILFNWTLCTAVKLSNPEMINSVNKIPSILGCPYFGIWTTDAARW
jgi:hypothetical protein